MTDSDIEDDGHQDKKQAACVYIFAWRWSYTPKWGTLEAFKAEHANISSVLAVDKGKKGGYLFQLECTPRERQPDCKGDDHVDNWHYQGYLRTTKRQRPTAVGASLGKVFPGIWVTAGVDGALAALRKYCMKRDETYRAGPWGDQPIQDPVDEYKGEDLPKVLWKWEEQILATLAWPNPDNRTINWVFEPVGTKGKSVFCKWAVFHKKAFWISVAKASDIANVIIERGHGDRVYFMDIPRQTSKCIDHSETYQILEQIKNGMLFCGKYHGGHLQFYSPHVWVFSNYLPKFECLSKDRLKVWTIGDREGPLIPWVAAAAKNTEGSSTSKAKTAARLPAGGLPGAQDVDDMVDVDT